MGEVISREKLKEITDRLISVGFLDVNDATDVSKIIPGTQPPPAGSKGVQFNLDGYNALLVLIALLKGEMTIRVAAYVGEPSLMDLLALSAIEGTQALVSDEIVDWPKRQAKNN